MPLVVDPEGHSRLVRDTDEDRQSCRTATTANGAATDQEPYLQVSHAVLGVLLILRPRASGED